MNTLLRRTQALLLTASALFSISCFSASPAELAAYRLLRTPPSSEQVAGEPVCHLHGLRTIATITPERAGMCVEPSWRERAYIEARVRRFPNSYWEVDSCFCEGPDSIRSVRACPRCREVERAWRSSHGMTVVEEYPLDPRAV